MSNCLWSVKFFVMATLKRRGGKKKEKLSIRHQNGVIEGNLLFVWSTI